MMVNYIAVKNLLIKVNLLYFSLQEKPWFAQSFIRFLFYLLPCQHTCFLSILL